MPGFLTGGENKQYTVAVMEYSLENHKLSISFLLSVLIHLTLLLLLSIFTGGFIMPAVPDVPRLIVELFEQAQEETDEKPDLINRVAVVTRKVEKEMVPREIPSEGERNRAITAKKAQPKAETQKHVMESDNETGAKSYKTEPVDMAETPLRVAKGEAAGKELPPIESLIPSIDQLVLSGRVEELPRDVAEGPEISLNTSEFKYLSYFSKIKSAIKMVWVYPEAAKMAGLQGNLTLRFMLKSDGTLKDVKVLKPSGFPVLDDAAVKAIRKAAPYPAIPKALGNSLNITANFEYAIDYYHMGDRGFQ